jgi:hypothetical protein
MSQPHEIIIKSIGCDRVALRADYAHVPISGFEDVELRAVRNDVIAKMNIVTYIVKHQDSVR